MLKVVHRTSIEDGMYEPAADYDHAALTTRVGRFRWRGAGIHSPRAGRTPDALSTTPHRGNRPKRTGRSQR